jgi:hypothetical protein
MYLRTIVALFFATLLMTTSLLNSSSQASTWNHFHRYHSHHHFSLNRRGTDGPLFRHHRLSARHFRMRAAHFHRRHGEPSSYSVGVGGLHGELAAKAYEIVSSCGSTIISAFRPGAHIAGSGHASLHASGRAIDVRGNPECIYSHLHGWPGGYSIDYGSVQHVHISLGGFEDGVRFSHYGFHNRHRRYG